MCIWPAIISLTTNKMIIIVIFVIKISKNTCNLMSKQLQQNDNNGTEGP